MSTILTPPSMPRPAERDAPITEPSTLAAPPVPAVTEPIPAPAAGRPPTRATKRARQHPHRRARLITGAVVLTVVGGIAYIMRPTPMAVDAAPVRAGPMQTTVEVDAVSRVRDHFAIAAPVGGMVQRLTLREGDS